MKMPAFDARQWKIVLCAALLLFSAVWVVAAANWRQVLEPGVAGSLRADTASPFGREARLVRVAPDSPLAPLGLQAGATLTFDRVSDGWRVALAAHEPVGMTIAAGSARRHVTVEAAVLRAIDPATATAYILVLVNSLVALVLAGLIGLRRASSTSARLLALVLLAEPSFAIQFMPGGTLMTLGVLAIVPLVIVATYCGFFLFSCYFPGDSAAHVPAWVRRTGWPVMLVVVSGGAMEAAMRCGWMAMPRVITIVQPVVILLVVGLSSVNLWYAYRQASGAARQRVQWVGLALGVRFLNYLLATIPGIPFVQTAAFSEAAIVLTTLANIGLAYGILRHRLFDLGFAVNRALVYAFVSVALLVSFGLLEWMAHHVVSPEEAEKNALLDAAIALALYLVFHKLRHTVEHGVERLFFHRWHDNEARLRRFVKQAAHVTSSAALVDATLAALQCFTGEAGCALYRLRDGAYECDGGAGMPMPARLGIDDPLAVVLRAEPGPVVPAECGTAMPGALALPMRLRGELQGIVLLGPKPGHGAYRPDEVAVLEFAAHQVGLDLQALQTEGLKAEVDALRQELCILSKALELNGKMHVA